MTTDVGCIVLRSTPAPSGPGHVVNDRTAENSPDGLSFRSGFGFFEPSTPCPALPDDVS
jgi:hypothetical protein